MHALDLPCLDGKVVSLSKPRTLPNPDGSVTCEVDVVLATLVFRRQKDAPIIFCGAFCDVWHDERVTRVPYVHAVDGALVSQAQDRAFVACVEDDGEPVTERKGAP